MARVLLIANPRARRAGPEHVRAVVDVLVGAGWAVETATSTDPGETRRLATEAVSGGWDLLAIMGGDGTVTEALTPLVGTDLAVGIVPAGTGNLLAGNLGIPRAPVAAARAMLTGRPRRLDLGRADLADGSRHFVIAAGAGFDARVMAATHPTRKRRLGKLAYFTTAAVLATRLRSVPHTLTIDGASRELDAAEVIVANVGELVPHLLRPRLPILPDDGLLDVIVVTAGGPVQGLLGSWEAITHPTAGEHPGGRLFRARVQEVRVEARPAQPVELDGDVRGTTPFVASVVPAAVSVIVPR